MIRAGGIDCGTNSIRLLVADVAEGENGAELTDIYRTMQVVRLGEGVDSTGYLCEAALERTLAAVDEYGQKCRELGVEKLRFVATSASRDAKNADYFVAQVRARLGVEPEVVPGIEEAQLSFSGAVSGLRVPIMRPVLVVDIGGGSTEFILGDQQAYAAHSVNMGCVRVNERFLVRGAVQEARLFIRELLDQVEEHVDFSAAKTLIGQAGTVTTVTAHALRLEKYDPTRIDQSRLTFTQIAASCQALRLAERREKEQLGFLHPGRVDVIGAGSLVWEEIIARVAERSGINDAITSEHDILDGIVLSAARG